MLKNDNIDKMKEEKVLIGDCLGTIEEFVPGEGTYAEEGKIYAAKMGKVILDKEKHIAKVEAKPMPELSVGQTVFGEITGVRKNNVIVNVTKIKGIKGNVEVKTCIYVSNISDGYVEKPEDMFGIGDIVKAQVIKMNPDVIDLSTKKEFGVVKAFCKRCRAELVKSDKSKDGVKCPECGNRESRKIAIDYGNVSEM